MNKVIDRIRKLLALANGAGTTPEEAALAATRAQELLAAHELDMATVEAHGGAKAKDADGPIGQEPSERITRSKVAWMGRLAHSIATAGGGSMYWSTRMIGGERVVMAVFIGRPSQVAAWKVMYEFLLDEIDRLATRAIKALPAWEEKRAYGNSFRLGAADVVGARLHVAAREQRQSFAAAPASTASTALAIVDKNRGEVASFVKGLKLRAGGTDRGPSRGDGYGAGRKAGEGINLGGKIGASSGRSAIAK